MKLLNLIFITFLAIAIGACGGTATEKKKDDATDATKTEKKDDAENKDDTAKTDEEPKTDSASETPTEGVTAFIKAFQAKDIEGVKKRISKSSLSGMEAEAKKAEKTLDEMLKTFVELPMPFKGTPEMRNEKIDGDKATIEINAEGKWEPTPLVKEDGIWKMAFEDTKK